MPKTPTIGAVYKIEQFCELHGISKSQYYSLRRSGLGPREMRLGGAVRIALSDAEAWRRAMSDPQGAAAKAAEETRERYVDRAKRGWAGKERRRLERARRAGAAA